jgi:hypothetical protein
VTEEKEEELYEEVCYTLYNRERKGVSSMSTQLPRLEARVRAQERLTTMLHARIEELSQDMGASFDQLVEYQIATERKLDARFDKIEAQITSMENRMATKEDVASLEARMATKEDVAALEARVLDAFQQLVTMIDTRLPPPR